MTPQAILKARFSELAESLDIELSVRRQSGNFYFTVTGTWKNTNKFMSRSFPEAWVTSAAGPQCVYGLPLTDVERVLSESHVEPDWLINNDSVALRIAQKMREDGTFFALPILADALEEAGCENAAILNHCRAAEPHHGTCWVVELMLGPGKRRRIPRADP